MRILNRGLIFEASRQSAAAPDNTSFGWGNDARVRVDYSRPAQLRQVIITIDHCRFGKWAADAESDWERTQ